jgi:hypothetical protein
MWSYPEVPEWWFLCIIVFSFAFGVAALEGWPTNCPWWALVMLVGVNAIFLVPSAIMAAAANVTLNTGVLFQLLAGVVFAGNPLYLGSKDGSLCQGSASSDFPSSDYCRLPKLLHLYRYVELDG